MGTDAYTQVELEVALRNLESAFYQAGRRAQYQDWPGYRKVMQDIDLQYRRLRSQGPGLGAEPTRQ